MLLRYGIGGRGSQIPRLLPNERVSIPSPEPPPLNSFPISRCLGGTPTPSPPGTHGHRRFASTGWGRGPRRWPSLIAAGQGGTVSPTKAAAMIAFPPLSPCRVSSRSCRLPPSASAGRRNSHRGAFPQNFSACGPGCVPPLRWAQQAALLTWRGAAAPWERRAEPAGGAAGPGAANARPPCCLAGRCAPLRSALPAAPPLPGPALRLRARREERAGRGGREGGDLPLAPATQRGGAARLPPGAGCGSHPSSFRGRAGIARAGPTERIARSVGSTVGCLQRVLLLPPVPTRFPSKIGIRLIVLLI